MPPTLEKPSPSILGIIGGPPCMIGEFSTGSRYLITNSPLTARVELHRRLPPRFRDSSGTEPRPSFTVRLSTVCGLLEPGTMVLSESKGAPAGTSTWGMLIYIDTSPFPTASLIGPGFMRTLIRGAGSAPRNTAATDRTVASAIMVEVFILLSPRARVYEKSLSLLG